jgi:4-oxalocrotonate tautomerase
MPIINVTVAATPAPELTRRIAKAITGLTVKHLSKDPNLTAVIVHYIDPANWYAGGSALAVQKTSSYWLDIKVVDGTNTKAEIAEYLRAVHAELGAILSGVHNESYTHVDEVAAHGYGFGGKTQEHRFIAKQLGQT